MYATGACKPAAKWLALTTAPSFFSSPHSGNTERSEALHDNTLTLTVPLVHEVDTSITG